MLGSPIAHSLSPVLHAAGYAALGLSDWSYGRHEVRAEGLPDFLAGLDADWRGLSLTMPLKEACLELAAEVTPLAARARAGNTLVRREDGRWLADNTDIPGMADALRPVWDAAWRRVAVLGAGATARSALLALTDLGVTAIDVYARDLGKASALEAWAPPGVEITPLPLAEWPAGEQPVVVSTLPAGALDDVALPSPRLGLVFDVVYAGWPTPLARSAEAAGMAVVGGLDLLVHQAARQFTLFTGRGAPLDAMFAAGREAVGGGSGATREQPGSPAPEESA
ncbi:MAG: shikimate dehydrogenase [Propionicimonas sp.]|uniref:shikimate dehydrogenase n=1 Tax=Propionicimonas sp. TaxID=1955623 RepID=UPI003D14BE5F